MRYRVLTPALLAGLVLLVGRVGQADTKERATEMNTALMQATFLIQGNGVQGTAFLMARPCPNRPERLVFRLLTAAHVLEGVQGDTATLFLREEKGPGRWELLPFRVTIRARD